MVLIKNNGEKDVVLSWETSRYVIRPGETASVGSTVARAIQRRYPAVSLNGVESEAVSQVDEVIVDPGTSSEESETQAEDGSNPPDEMELDSNSEEEETTKPTLPPDSPKNQKTLSGHFRNQSRKQRRR